MSDGDIIDRGADNLHQELLMRHADTMTEDDLEDAVESYQAFGWEGAAEVAQELLEQKRGE